MERSGLQASDHVEVKCNALFDKMADKELNEEKEQFLLVDTEATTLTEHHVEGDSEFETAVETETIDSTGGTVCELASPGSMPDQRP